MFTFCNQVALPKKVAASKSLVSMHVFTVRNNLASILSFDFLIRAIFVFILFAQPGLLVSSSING